MTNTLFNGKEQIFKDVIRLAENWKNAYHLSGFEGGSMEEIRAFHATPVGQKIDSLHTFLENYMKTLNFDDVKMLQTVMYLGGIRIMINHYYPKIFIMTI